MNQKTANDVIKAVFIIADFLEMPAKEVIQKVCFLEKEKWEKFVAANKMYNDYLGMNIIERARSLGFEVVEEVLTP